MTGSALLCRITVTALKLDCTHARIFGFLAGVSGSRILAAAPILEPGSCHAESPNR